ncbi:MAG: PH domain-containing protein [Thermoproteales archaeon]|nr:PH domain-containing protein [Thermoproteales archaeon]
MSSPYKEYAQYKSIRLHETRPSIMGFLRRYLLGFVSLIIYFLSLFIASLFNIQAYFVILYIVFLVFSLILSWVLRSKEALSSLVLGLTMIIILGHRKLINLSLTSLFVVLLNIFQKYGLISSIIASVIVIFSIEIYRRSILYIITDTGIVLKGGIWRTQYHSIPYNQIGRVILEQSLVGKMLNYGTIIFVSAAEWGSEYYSRGLSASYEKKGIGLGMQYFRTLKEISRDPLKCLYGVKNPFVIRDVIEKMITAPYRAEIDQARYLREIRDMLKGKN